jgi:hypothetical protein
MSFQLLIKLCLSQISFRHENGWESKKKKIAGRRWLTPVNLATSEAEISRISV